MKATLPALTVVLATVSLFASQQPVITAKEAGAYVGRPVTIEDAVAQVSHEPQSGFTYLNFGGEFPKHAFRVIVPDAIRAKIAASVLTASRLRVTGTPRLDVRGVPEIVCFEPTQLVALVGGVSPATAGVAPTPRTTSTPAPRSQPCCRVCTTGKACGNSCIARTSTCRQPPGCACNG